MGWSESRVMLFPPRWRPRTEEAPRGRTANGAPVRLVYSERSESSVGVVVDPQTVSAWLQERGFEIRGRFAHHPTLGLEDIELDLFSTDGELSHVDLTFSLSKQSPDRWEAWRSFVTEFCNAWKLELGDTEHDIKVGPGELFRLLASHPSWKDFQQAFAWPSAVRTGA